MEILGTNRWHNHVIIIIASICVTAIVLNFIDQGDPSLVPMEIILALPIGTVLGMFIGTYSYAFVILPVYFLGHLYYASKSLFCSLLYKR